MTAVPPPALQDSDEAARLQAAVVAAQLGTFEWNLRTHNVRLDARSREIFGFGPDEGTTAAQVFARMHPDDQPWVREFTLATLARGERVDVEYRVQLPSGAIRHVSSSGTVLRGADNRREIVFGVFADVTDRKWNQIRNQVLVELNDRLDALTDSREARYVAAEILGTALGLSRVAYGMVDAAHGLVDIERDWANRGVPSAAGTYPLSDYGALIPQLATGQVVAIGDTARDPRPAQAGEARRSFVAGAVLLLPIIERGELVAILFLNHATAREWLAREVALVREVAERVRDSSERKRAEAALRESENRHAFLLRLGDRLRSLSDAAEIQSAAAELLARHVGAGRAHYCEHDLAGGRCFVERDFVADGGPSLAGAYRLDDFPSLHALLDRGEPVVVDDIETGALLESAEAARFRTLGMRSFVCIPLLHAGRLAASLTLAVSGPRHWSAQEVALARDTAERTWAAIERARAEAALRTADRRKDEFLATLAHELRNPLAPIRNGLQIARLTARSDATLMRTVDMMDRQLTHLVRLVDDLLDVGRISSGKLQLRHDPVSLAQVLASSMEATHVLLERHGHRLSADTSAGDLQVEGDFDRLAQVFTNLLSNAAKYTDPGGTIHLRLARVGGQAEVSVTDSGIGIAPEDLQQVFDLFSQVRTHQGRTEGGLGIGLALVRSLVALHGGTVEARSGGLGEGSTFIVRLPLLARRVAEEPAAAAPQPQVAPRRRILVADDNADAASTLATLLELHGHEVWTAEDGVVALERARELGPDLVFLDLGMPRMGGIEAAQRMRAEGLAPPAKLVALTGWGQEADRRRTTEAGFDWHLVKPVDMAALDAILAALPVQGTPGVDNRHP